MPDLQAVRLLALAGNIDALIAEIRLHTPLQALAQRGGFSLEERSFHDCSAADLRRADVLIVQRGLGQRVARLQRQMRRQGGTVLYEIDDLLTELPDHVSNQGRVLAQREHLLDCMRQADLVTVSTERLGRTLMPPHWQVVPNYALPLGDAAMPPLQAGHPVTFVLASMEALAPHALYQALRELPAGLARVVAVGPVAASLAAAGVMVESHPLMPRRAFITWVRSLPNPVAVIPLEDSRFAACKSAIKWFDYGEAGVPVLCSAVSPYCEVVEPGRTGWLVANDASAWQQALTQVAMAGEWRQQVAQAAREAVRARHTLDLTVQAWAAAITHAQQLRQQAGAPSSAGLTRWRDALALTLDAVGRPLRRFNRARLARRQQR